VPYDIIAERGLFAMSRIGVWNLRLKHGQQRGVLAGFVAWSQPGTNWQNAQRRRRLFREPHFDHIRQIGRLPGGSLETMGRAA
jgi:hypothetical protein